MKEYGIERTEGAPDWSKISVLSVDEVLWLPHAGIRMEQQLCYDETALYIRQRAWERHLRAVENDPLGQVCNDSCMEFFVDFAEDGRYFNVEVNPNGKLYLGFGGSRSLRSRLILKQPVQLLDMQTQYLDDGWEIRYCLPLSFLRQFYPQLSFRAGVRFRANCYKCGDRTQQPHYLAWNPVKSPYPDFHRPSDFGWMRLL